MEEVMELVGVEQFLNILPTVAERKLGRVYKQENWQASKEKGFPRSTEDSSIKKDGVKCRCCGKTGHMEKECRKKIADMKEKTAGSRDT